MDSSTPRSVLHYTHNLSPRLAVAVARHLKAPVEYRRSHPRDPAQAAVFEPLNPNLLCPILVEGERSTWETDALACRLSQMVESSFWPWGDGLVDLVRWMSWSAHHFNRAAGDLYFFRVVRPNWSDEAPDPALMAGLESELRTHAKVLDDTLKVRRWLVGDRLSYADFRVACALPFEKAALPLQGFANIHRWHAQLMEIDAWRQPFDGLA
jgi:glutathione S-transferase